MIRFYNFLLFCLNPFINLYLRKRKKIGKEDLENFDQRLGKFKCARPAGKLIWIHAVSVGESLSIIPLVNELCEREQLNILVTSTTVTSAKLIKERIHKKAFHQFLPIDKKSYVQNFLNYFKPDLAILVESELWPNLINETAKQKIPLILLNARISPKTGFEWFCYRFFAKNLLKKFALILPQEQDQLAILQQLKATNIKYIGNLKRAAPALPYEQTELAKLQKLYAPYKIFLAASTHPGEEEIITTSYARLRQKIPELRLIIVPRHPVRGADLAAEFSKDFQLVSRSKHTDLAGVPELYLADTLGELGLFYQLADYALIGGSLVDIGGHNPLEALKANCLPLSGNYIKNFKIIYQELLEEQASFLGDINELEELIIKLNQEQKLLKEYQDNCQKVAKADQQIMAEAIEIIKSRIK